MNDWEVQLLIEAFTIVIFLAQVVLLFFDRLRAVSERLEETRRALMDLADRLPARKGEP